MTITVVNYGDGIYLEMQQMNHVSVKRIQLNQEGDIAFGVVAYPGPGMGYNLASYSDENEALATFSMLVNTRKSNKRSYYFS